MKAEFSEIQFLFGVIREIEEIMANGGYQSIIPIFTTQRQEKMDGWDAKVAVNQFSVTFFQFKMPEHIEGRNASEWNNI